jgi:hypothetical protein
MESIKCPERETSNIQHRTCSVEVALRSQRAERPTRLLEFRCGLYGEHPASRGLIAVRRTSASRRKAVITYHQSISSLVTSIFCTKHIERRTSKWSEIRADASKTVALARWHAQVRHHLRAIVSYQKKIGPHLRDENGTAVDQQFHLHLGGVPALTRFRHNGRTLAFLELTS